ncbi:MAG TPA: hypothetical protein VFN95_08940 [Flavitalea sp.]|nr:hypothetical protein [Flavitalea sp.]
MKIVNTLNLPIARGGGEVTTGCIIDGGWPSEGVFTGEAFKLL